LAAQTDATKVNSVVSSNKLSIVTESAVPIVVDEIFESETGEFDHHMSDNAISENLSVFNNSVDIPDVINVVVDFPTNNTCGKLPKCHNVVEVQTNGITVICNFCPFESNRVKEFHQHLREIHANTYGSR